MKRELYDGLTCVGRIVVPPLIVAQSLWASVVYTVGAVMLIPTAAVIMFGSAVCGGSEQDAPHRNYRRP